MNEKTVVIATAADAKFGGYAADLVRSLRMTIGDRHAIALFDVGLTPPMRGWFQERVDTVIDPGWHLPKGVTPNSAGWTRALTERPHLPKYLTGYQTIVWLDADTWVQHQGAVELLIAGARHGGMAIAPEAHPAYANNFDGGNTVHWWHDQYVRWFGRDFGRRYMFHPIYNSGVFALKADAPHWKAWAESYDIGLSAQIKRHGGIIDLNDQVSLNLAIHHIGLKVNPAPALCNFLLNKATPLYDPRRALFLDPCMPHAPIGILHLSGKDKDQPKDVAFFGANGRMRSFLRYDPTRRRERPQAPPGSAPATLDTASGGQAQAGTTTAEPAEEAAPAKSKKARAGKSRKAKSESGGR